MSLIYQYLYLSMLPVIAITIAMTCGKNRSLPSSSSQSKKLKKPSDNEPLPNEDDDKQPDHQQQQQSSSHQSSSEVKSKKESSFKKLLSKRSSKREASEPLPQVQNPPVEESKKVAQPRAPSPQGPKKTVQDSSTMNPTRYENDRLLSGKPLPGDGNSKPPDDKDDSSVKEDESQKQSGTGGSEVDVRMSDLEEASKKEKERKRAAMHLKVEKSSKKADGKKDDGDDEDEDKSASKKKKSNSSKKKKKKSKKDKKKKKKGSKKDKKKQEYEDPTGPAVLDPEPPAVLQPTQYENLYPQYLTTPPPSSKYDDKTMSFMSKLNQRIAGATATEDVGVEITKDTYLTGVNPKVFQDYLNKRGPTMLTGVEGENMPKTTMVQPASPQFPDLAPTQELSNREPSSLPLNSPKQVSSKYVDAELQKTQTYLSREYPSKRLDPNANDKRDDPTQENLYLRSFSTSLSLHSLQPTQDLLQVNETQKLSETTQTQLETTQTNIGSTQWSGADPFSASTQKTAGTKHVSSTQTGGPSLMTGISRGDAYATGREKISVSNSQNPDSTQTLANVASLTPIETTQQSATRMGTTQTNMGSTQMSATSVAATQPSTNFTQRNTMSIAPVVTAVENPKSPSGAPEMSLPSSEVHTAARITLNEEHETCPYPKPKHLPRTDKAQKIHNLGLKRGADDYPTFKDIQSDWGSEDDKKLKERTAKGTMNDDPDLVRQQQTSQQRAQGGIDEGKKKVETEKKRNPNAEKKQGGAVTPEGKREEDREARRAAEEERVRQLRANAPKPRPLQRNTYEENIVKGNLTRKKHDYPTMNDIDSDWESKESTERDSTDHQASPGPNGIPQQGSVTKSKTAQGDDKE